MSKTTVHLTPVSNIMDDRLIDNTKVIARQFDSLTEPFTFINIHTGEERVGNLMQASLYDDTMVYEGKHYRILKMLTKES